MYHYRSISKGKRLLAVLMSIMMAVVFMPVLSMDTARAEGDEGITLTGFTYTPAKQYVFYEGIDSKKLTYWDYDSDSFADYMGYDPMSGPGDSIRLTYSNGEERTFIENSSGWWYEDGDESKDQLPGNISFETDQRHDNEWAVGDHEIIVRYSDHTEGGSLTCKLNAKVCANPVDSIEYSPAGGEGYWRYEGDSRLSWDNDENNKYEKYEEFSFEEGDKLTVHYNDGRGDVVYNYSYPGKTESGFYSNDGDYLCDSLFESFPDYVCIANNQSYESQWKKGVNKNAVVISYAGKSVNLDVTIKESDVDSMHYVPGTKSGNFEIDEMELDVYSELYEAYNDTVGSLIPGSEAGDKLIIEKNGSQKTYVCNELHDTEGFFYGVEFVNEKDKNDKLTGGVDKVKIDSLKYTVTDYNNKADTKQVTVRFHGKTTEVPLKINRISGEAREVADKIMTIPSPLKAVKKTDESKVQAARAAYDALDDAKNKVPLAYRERLRIAERWLKEMDAAEKIKDEIKRLKNTDNVTLKDRWLEFQWSLDDSYPLGYRDFFTDEELKEAREVIEAAQARIDELENVVDNEAVNSISQMINGLKPVNELTLEDEADVMAAKTAYDALSNASRAKVNESLISKLQNSFYTIDGLKLKKLMDEISKLPDPKSLTIETATDELRKQIVELRARLGEISQEVLMLNNLDYPSIEDALCQLQNAINSVINNEDDNEEEKGKKIRAIRKAIDGLDAVEDPAEYYEAAGKVVTAYKNLSLELKNRGGSHLRRAIERIEEKIQSAEQIAMDKEAGANVDALIDAIGNVSKNSKAKITAARDAYNKLTAEQKKFVTKLNVLTAAEKKYAQIIAAEEAQAKYKKAVSNAKALTVANLKVKANKGKTATVTWSVNKTAAGYQLQYSLKKNFAKAKTVKVNGTNKNSKTIKKLKVKKYYVRIRTFAKVKNVKGGTETYYGKWSGRKTFKAKK